MNNGICSTINSPNPYQTDYLSNYISTNLIRYSQSDSSLPQGLLGNTSPIPSIYGLPVNTNSTLDLENNLIYIVDTSVDPVVQNSGAATQYSIRSTLVQIPTTQIATSLIIDWGDGIIETYSSNPSIASHIYNVHGIYYIQIRFPTTLMNSDYYAPANWPLLNGRDGKIIGILSFGNKISSLTLQFFRNIFLVPKILPKNITSLTIFQMGGVLGSNVSDWNISNLTTKIQIGTSLFNQDVSKWVFNAAITDFSNLFASCGSFNNGDTYTPSLSTTVPIPAFPAGDRLNIWNTSNVTNMSQMFYNSPYFNQNLNSWNVSKVTNFTSMFGSIHNTFNSFDGDLSNWQLVATGVNCTSMFAIDINSANRGRLFTGKGLNTWNTTGVTNMRNMFGGNTLFNQNLSNFTTSNVTDMSYMFSACSSFAGSGLSSWNTNNVTNISNMFSNAVSFNQSLNNWNTSNVTDMSSMFQLASNFNQPLNNWNVRKVTTFTSMFQGATNFNSSLSGWALGADTAGTSCSNMFRDATAFNQDISNWDVSKVTNMSSMFNGATNLGSGININLNNWNISGVNNFSSMFMNTLSASSSINNINIDNWSFNSSDLSYMFRNSGWKRSLSGWNVSKVTNMAGMFYGNYGTVPGSGIETWNLAGLNSAGGLDLFATTCTFSSGQYDLILNSWNNNKLAAANGVANWRTDLRPDFGGNKYTAGGAAATARAALVSYGWTITDGGSV